MSLQLKVVIIFIHKKNTLEQIYITNKTISSSEIIQMLAKTFISDVDACLLSEGQ